MDVQAKVREISARIETETATASASGAASGAGQQYKELLEAFQFSCARLIGIRNSVGQMPPCPNSMRGRLGAFLVRVVQRTLFWYTPQLTRFHNETARALDAALDLAQCGSGILAALLEEVAALDREVRKSRAERFVRAGDLPRPTDPAGPCRGRDNPETEARADQEREVLLRCFQFDAEDCFRGPESETSQKLWTYLERVNALHPPPPPGPWLDVGCGRGEWLEALRSVGHKALGTDSNPLMVAYCREKQLEVVQDDALAHLRRLPEGSLAVVTAFHVLEHLPHDMMFLLVQQAARVLQPGGILIVETPNPTNLLVAADYFWRDPTHHRPIPPALLELILRYFGFSVVERLDLNPLPEELRLPYGSLEFVRRLNEQFYGTQDYGFIARH